MRILKKILGTVIFFGIGILLFQGISYLLRPIDRDFYRKDIAGFYGEEKNSLDVAVFGSSSVDRYFNNPVLWEENKLTSYSLASANQSCFILEHLIDEVEKTQSPQLYIVETRKFIQAEGKNSYSDRFSNVIDNMKYSWNRVKLINYMIDDWEERVNYYFDIISYHDSWEYFAYENLQYAANAYKDPQKGWVNVAKIRKAKEPKIISPEEGKPVPIASECEEALRSLLKKCREEKIPVLFVATPFAISEKGQQKNMYIASIIEEAGFQFLDCNQYIKEMGLDFSQDFYNPKHANMLGTEKITRFIGNYIQENFDLSTEHSEKVTADWNEYAQRNRTEAEALKAELLDKK